jgi:hypothetical protein
MDLPASALRTEGSIRKLELGWNVRMCAWEWLWHQETRQRSRRVRETEGRLFRNRHHHYPYVSARECAAARYLFKSICAINQVINMRQEVGRARYSHRSLVILQTSAPLPALMVQGYGPNIKYSLNPECCSSHLTLTSDIYHSFDSCICVPSLVFCLSVFVSIRRLYFVNTEHQRDRMLLPWE